MTLLSASIAVLCLTYTVTKGDDSCPGLPNCFCNKDKTSVNCDGKQFTSVPDNIPENVTKLYLRFNSILEIKAKTFSRFTKLEKLFLKTNKIAKIEPLAFGGAVSLEYIDLSKNKLAIIGKDAFSQLPNLQQLYLTTNNLETVDEHAFEGSENLRYINLQSNVLTSIPSLGKQPKFQKLILQSNRVTYATFPRSYAASKDMQYIGLSSNNIESLGNGTFETLGNISIASLYISTNKLKKIESGTFASLASIKSLSLGRNPLDNNGLKAALQGLKGKDIVSLDISALRLNGPLLQDTFKLLQDTTITSLNMRYNKIPSIVNGSFTGLDNLIQLDLSNCQITKTEAQAFVGLDKLQILNLNKNNLINVPDNLPPTLLRLFMDNNQIISIKEMVFKKQAYLQELRIRYNKLQTIMKNSFNGLVNLNKLDLMNNYISTLPGTVFNPLVRLTSLHLAQNSLNQIQNTTDIFSSLGSLVYFNMAENNCFFFQRDIFKFMASLKYLHLEKNHLGTVVSSDYDGTVFRGLGKLEELYLMDNDVSELQAPAFQDLSSLTRLNLTNNKVKTWSSNLFRTTPHLKYLDLTNNLIAVPKKENMDHFKSLEELNLTGNPFLCGCDLRWFRDWINQTSVKLINLKSYTCTEPKTWSGKQLMSFDRTKINCLFFSWQVIVGVSCGVALVIVIAMVIVYRKRWHIKLRWYKFRQGRRAYDGRGKYGAIIDDRSYDAFISYAEDDNAWVIENILHGIDKGDLNERPFGGQFSLYFEERDSVPGQRKMANICEHMMHSRNVIVILSHNYLKDSYHLFELDEAIHAMYNEVIQGIIVVYIGQGLPKRKIPRELADTMRRHEMIEWADDDDARGLCKEQLIKRLKGTAYAANVDVD